MKRALTIILVSFFFLPNLCYAGINFYPENASERQFSYEIEPGNSAEGTVVLQNIENTPVIVQLYGADGTQSNMGTFALTLKSKEQWHIGTWIKFDEPEVELAAHEERLIPFRVEIPSSATPGTYSGGLAAEVIKSGSADGSLGQVSTSARNVIKLYVAIPGDITHNYDWQSFIYYPKGEKGDEAKFSLSYLNTGNTIVNVEQKIIFKGFPPLSEEDSELELNTLSLIPGKETNINTAWDNIPFFGFYTATANITFYEYDIIGNKNINPEIKSKLIEITIIPALESALLLILIVAIIIFLLTRYVIRVRYYRCLIEYKVKSNDTLESIAKKHNTTWEKVVKLNYLKKPYTVKKGQILCVPPIKKKSTNKK